MKLYTMKVNTGMTVFDECLVKGVYEKMHLEKLNAEKACDVMASINDVESNYVESLFKKYESMVMVCISGDKRN